MHSSWPKWVGYPVVYLCGGGGDGEVVVVVFLLVVCQLQSQPDDTVHYGYYQYLPQQLTQHVHEQQLGHIPMPILLLLLPDGRTNHGTLLGDDGTFFGGGFAGADLPDEIAEFERHGIVRWWRRQLVLAT